MPRSLRIRFMVSAIPSLLAAAMASQSLIASTFFFENWAPPIGASQAYTFGAAGSSVNAEFKTQSVANASLANSWAKAAPFASVQEFDGFNVVGLSSGVSAYAAGTGYASQAEVAIPIHLSAPGLVDILIKRANATAGEGSQSEYSVIAYTSLSMLLERDASLPLAPLVGFEKDLSKTGQQLLSASGGVSWFNGSSRSESTSVWSNQMPLGIIQPIATYSGSLQFMAPTDWVLDVFASGTNFPASINNPVAGKFSGASVDPIVTIDPANPNIILTTPGVGPNPNPSEQLFSDSQLQSMPADQRQSLIDAGFLSPIGTSSAPEPGSLICAVAALAALAGTRWRLRRSVCTP